MVHQKRLGHSELTSQPQGCISTSSLGTMWLTSCSWRLLLVLASLTPIAVPICWVPATVEPVRLLKLHPYCYLSSFTEFIFVSDLSLKVVISAMDSLEFLIRWLDRFPRYQNREVYITGESYAGHYVPQLARQIMVYNKKSRHPINLKGIMVMCNISYNLQPFFFFLGFSEEIVKVEMECRWEMQWQTTIMITLGQWHTGGAMPWFLIKRISNSSTHAISDGRKSRTSANRCILMPWIKNLETLISTTYMLPLAITQMAAVLPGIVCDCLIDHIRYQYLSLYIFIENMQLSQIRPMYDHS